MTEDGVAFRYIIPYAPYLSSRVKQHHSSPISGFIRGEIGRATIGGDKGFLMGAMTAPQYTSEHHKYIIQIITTHPQHKTIHYVTSSEDNGEMAIMILENILSTNKVDSIYGNVLHQ